MLFAINRQKYLSMNFIKIRIDFLRISGTVLVIRPTFLLINL